VGGKKDEPLLQLVEVLVILVVLAVVASQTGGLYLNGLKEKGEIKKERRREEEGRKGGL